MARIQINRMQIISGTEIMRGEDHTRTIDVSVPRFASRPDITISAVMNQKAKNGLQGCSVSADIIGKNG